MRLIVIPLLCVCILPNGYAQSPDEEALLKRFILKTIVKGNRARQESNYATIVIQFSKQGYPYDVFFYGVSECFTESDEIRQDLLRGLSVQVRPDRKRFSNAYIIVPLLISKAEPIAESPSEALKVSESWASSFKNFNSEDLRKKHLKYIIPIQVVVYTSTH